jgi:hypothetical protein
LGVRAATRSARSGDQLAQGDGAELLLEAAGLTTAGAGADAAVARLAAWLPAVVAADGLGELLGLPEGEGLGLGELLGLPDGEGLGLGELLGLPEGEGLDDADVVVQLRDGDGNAVGELLTPPWLEEVAVLPEVAFPPPLPPPPGP